MRLPAITCADLITIIEEEVGFGRCVIGGADSRGMVIDGYLDLSAVAIRLNRLYELRNRARQLDEIEQAQ